MLLKIIINVFFWSEMLASLANQKKVYKGHFAMTVNVMQPKFDRYMFSIEIKFVYTFHNIRLSELKLETGNHFCLHERKNEQIMIALCQRRWVFRNEYFV